MRLVPRTMLGMLSFCALLVSSTAYAQQQLPQFQHVIIVVQENRTPDNLFGAGSTASKGNCGVGDIFEAGVDIDNGGYGIMNGKRQEICNIPTAMITGWGPYHRYMDPAPGINPAIEVGWVPEYDNGKMDGFCLPVNPVQTNPCLEYSYVSNAATDNPPYQVQPYFDIAKAYGFANYMFQTNEGPSNPAHMFLFSGTSAPTSPTGAYPLDFVAENDGGDGCPDTFHMPRWVQPDGSQVSAINGSYDCYDHDSLVTSEQGGKGVPWRYYVPVSGGGGWNAPMQLPEICYPHGVTTGNCGQAGSIYASHVVVATNSNAAPIFNDISGCALQKISWVIPDAAWSDHPGTPYGTTTLGPSWVADIVNAVGQSPCLDGTQTYWQDTVIFIVWDDWGGFYDHVPPPAVYRSPDPSSCKSQYAPNGWGCGYTYGFRVPFLVVSAYTDPGYVSGACSGTGATECPQAVSPYVHDFGSILAFAEHNFGLPFVDGADKGYADYNAPDWGQKRNNIPLSDFFDPALIGHPRTFASFSAPYNASYFEMYYQRNPLYTPTGPDDGPDD